MCGGVDKQLFACHVVVALILLSFYVMHEYAPGGRV